jgi:hypothetical protein
MMVGRQGVGTRYPSEIRKFFIDSFECHMLVKYVCIIDEISKVYYRDRGWREEKVEKKGC